MSEYVATSQDEVRIARLAIREVLPNPESAVLLAAATQGGKAAFSFFGKDISELELELKENEGDTPVTIADRRSEQVMSDFVELYYPNDSIYGEESKSVLKNPQVWWVEDGVDGTTSFIRKQTRWAVGLARCELITGLTIPTDAAIVEPALGRVLVAHRGQGTYRMQIDPVDGRIYSKPERVFVSTQDTLFDSMFILDGLHTDKNERKPEFVYMLRRQAKGEAGKSRIHERGIGTNLGAANDVALGEADFTVMDCVGGMQDILPAALIIEEAGGWYTDLQGKQMSIETAKQAVVTLGSNNTLHEQVLALLQQPYQNYRGFK